MGLIELDAVSRRYDVGGGTVTALDSVDLTVGAGEFVVVLGPSGSGKTTLLNLVGALDSPSSGTIVIDGKRISEAGSSDLFRFRRETVRVTAGSGPKVVTLGPVGRASASIA